LLSLDLVLQGTTSNARRMMTSDESLSPWLSGQSSLPKKQGQLLGAAPAITST
jgi:hypothetical protein